MNFENFFKVTTLLVLEIDGQFKKVFMPMLEKCSKAHDCGDVETAVGQLNFISSKVVEILEEN
jgi:hypothetical protein